MSVGLFEDRDVQAANQDDADLQKQKEELFAGSADTADGSCNAAIARSRMALQEHSVFLDQLSDYVREAEQLASDNARSLDNLTSKVDEILKKK